MLAHGREHVGQRHLDAEIDHPIAVVGQDDIDQVLADVVYVPLHRGEHDGAFFLALDALHERFEMCDSGLHGLGALQHERKLHLAGAEQLADHLHAVQQHGVDDVEGGQRLQRLVQIVGQPLAVAIDDAVLQTLLDRLGPLLADDVGGLAVGEHRQQGLQRVIPLAAAVEDQVLGDLYFLGCDHMQRADLRHMNNGAAHAGLYRMVQEHAVQHRARGGIEPEADIGQAEDDLDVGERRPDRTDALQRPFAQLAVVLVSGGDGEGQRVDQQVGLRQAVATAREIDQATRDCQLGVGGLRHTLLVDGQRDHRGPEALRQAQPLGGGALTVLEVDRVDDRLAAVQLQCRLDHRGFRAVDHQRRIHRGGEAAHHLGHFRHFVTADERGADVQAVGRLGDLLAPHGDAAVPVMRLLQLPPLLRAVGVAALADREVAVFLPQRDRLVEAGNRRYPYIGPQHRRRPEAFAARRPPPQHRIQRGDMRRVGAAAAADQVHPVLGDESFHPGRHLVRGQRIVGVAVHEFRQAGVGLDGDQAGPVPGEPADMLGHLLRAGGAVQAHQRHVQRVDHGSGGRDVGSDQQRAGGLHRHLHEDRRVGAGLGARDLGAVDRGLDLQRVLAGLDQDRVHTAGDQAAALRGERRLQRVVGDSAQAGQLGAGADAAHHPAVAAIGEGLGRLAGQFAG